MSMPQGPNPYGQQPYGQSPYPQAPQAPYGQPQGGYAYPQQQAPYGQPPQPGYPQAPQQPYIQGGAPVPPPQPSRNPSPKTILKGIGVVLVLVAFGFFWITSLDDAESAEAGDCVTKSSSTLDDGLKVVDCDTPEAQYKVVTVHNDTADMSVCPAGQTAYSKSVDRRKGSDTRMVLCMDPVK